MLLINVHQLDVVLADPVILCALKDKVDDIRRILGLESQDVLVLSGAQNLLQGGEVDSESDVAVASVGREGFGLEHHRHECDVRVVHGLEGETGVIAVKVAVLDQVLDGIDNLALVSPCCILEVSRLRTFLRS